MSIEIQSPYLINLNSLQAKLMAAQALDVSFQKYEVVNLFRESFPDSSEFKILYKYNTDKDETTISVTVPGDWQPYEWSE